MVSSNANFSSRRCLFADLAKFGPSQLGSYFFVVEMLEGNCGIQSSKGLKFRIGGSLGPKLIKIARLLLSQTIVVDNRSNDS